VFSATTSIPFTKPEISIVPELNKTEVTFGATSITVYLVLKSNNRHAIVYRFPRSLVLSNE
jgi:hypothetical protein